MLRAACCVLRADLRASRRPSQAEAVAETAARAAGKALNSIQGKVAGADPARWGALIDAAHRAATTLLEQSGLGFDWVAESSTAGKGVAVGIAPTWVVSLPGLVTDQGEPVDGGQPLSARVPYRMERVVSVGLVVKGAPAVGAIYDPFEDELFAGVLPIFRIPWARARWRV